ncbi:unnamed protein product [Rhizophagus irregularis]|nr:unnamed protein product [Rhizophagus irregularis]
MGRRSKVLRIMIMGTASTGKSYLIKMIRQKLHKMAGTDTDSPILVITPTEVAAFNINGSIIHSTLSILIRNPKNLELDSRQLKQLQERLQKNTSVDGNSNKGIAAYKHIREVFKLDVILRQTGNSNEQKEFCDILLRMCDGESSLDDWKILSIRFKENLNQQERERFSDAVFLLTT